MQSRMLIKVGCMRHVTGSRRWFIILLFAMRTSIYYIYFIYNNMMFIYIWHISQHSSPKQWSCCSLQLSSHHLPLNLYSRFFSHFHSTLCSKSRWCCIIFINLFLFSFTFICCIQLYYGTLYNRFFLASLVYGEVAIGFYISYRYTPYIYKYI